MLTNDRIVFHQLHLFRMIAWIFGGGYEVTGSRSGFQFDFSCNGCHSISPSKLYFLAFFTELVENFFNTQFINNSHTFSAYFQGNIAIFFFYPKAVRFDVRQKASSSFVVGMRYVVSSDGSLASDLAYS